MAVVVVVAAAADDLLGGDGMTGIFVSRCGAVADVSGAGCMRRLSSLLCGPAGLCSRG